MLFRMHGAPASVRRAAAFAAMPVLACGPVYSCKSGQPPDGQVHSASVAAQDVIRSRPPVQRAAQREDSAYTPGFVLGCPVWMVRAADYNHEYCIDRFEAHAVQKQGGAEVPHPASVRPAKFASLVARSAPGVMPQSSINRAQAEGACMNAGKRLCTLHEWSAACRGVQNRDFPYGASEKKGTCNTGKGHLISQLFGENWGLHMADPETNMIAGFLARTGEHVGCVSSFGAYDMVGNLHEWVSDPVDEEIIASMPLLKPGSGSSTFKAVPGNGIFMGGFYSSASQNGAGCNYMTIVHRPDQDDYSVGFRCCKDAEQY
jgi:formylglycine-generating enzyme